MKGIVYKMIGGDGVEYGPVSLEEMRQWIEEERLDRRSYVWSSEENRWRPAGEWPELQWDFSNPTLNAAPPPIIESRPVPAQPARTQLRPAGPFPRLAAYACDWIILVFVTSLLTLPWRDALMEFHEKAMAQVDSPTPDMGALFYFLWISLCIHVPISMAYHVGFNTRFGGTPGKLWIGMRILAEDYSPLTLHRACIRFLAEGLCVLTMGLGYLSLAFHPNRQGLHDLIAGTRVVHMPRGPSA